MFEVIGIVGTLWLVCGIGAVGFLLSQSTDAPGAIVALRIGTKLPLSAPVSAPFLAPLSAPLSVAPTALTSLEWLANPLHSANDPERSSQSAIRLAH